MTTLVVLQPGYLPWLGFFDQMLRADLFVYYDDVQFDKHGWRNRNRVKGPGGPQWLTVPVRHKGLGWPAIHEVEVVNQQPWAKKQLRTLRQLYAKAPYLEPYLGELEALLAQPWELLVDLDLAVTALMCRWLGVETPTVRSSQLGVEGDRNQRLLALCRYFGADHYISGAAARSYLDEPLFQEHGIRVSWHDYRHPSYPQLHGAFVSHLSALDLVLNVGPEAGGTLREGSLCGG